MACINVHIKRTETSILKFSINKDDINNTWAVVLMLTCGKLLCTGV